MTNRRTFLAGLTGYLGSTSLASATIGLASRGTAAILSETAPYGRHGFILMDADTGEMLDGSGQDDFFIPASLSKIPTSFAAMQVHGRDARFATKINADGEIANGVLNGDLHLIGGGDPSLDSQDLESLAAQLQSAGIYQVTGRFYYYAAALPHSEWLDRTQPWQAPYNPSMSGLNLNYNRVQFRWSDATGQLRIGGMAVSEGKVTPAPSVEFRVTSGGDISHQKSHTGEIWNIASSKLHGRGTRWLPVRKPAAFTASVFKALCAEYGIHMPDPEPAAGSPKGTQVAIHTSTSVREILRGMLKYSTNLTAEALGASAAYRNGTKPRNIRHAAGLTARLTADEVGSIGGNGWGGFALENHSGLSVLSRSTPRQIAAVLREGRRRFGEEYVSLYNDSTLSARRMGLGYGQIPPQHSILAKTGTMYFVRGFAGYMTVNGRNTVFAFMASEDSQRSAIDAAFTPYSDYRPQGSKSWLRRARAFEKAMLTDWVLRFSV